MKIQIMTAVMAASLVSFAAQAETATDNLVVSANVIESCVVSAEPLRFVDVNPLDTAPAVAQADITVTCTDGTDYTIGLNEGAGDGGTTSERQLTTGAGEDATTLAYALYSNPGRDINWGNDEDEDTVGDDGDGGEQVHTVYGEITGSLASAVAGNYQDTVQITVTY